MVEFCQVHSIPHEVCGKVVVAASADEVPRLQDLYQRGQENGLSGLRLLSPEELREIEPHAAGVAAIHVPEEGIADYPRVCEVLAQEIRRSRRRSQHRRRKSARSFPTRAAGASFTPRANAPAIGSSLAPVCIRIAWPRSRDAPRSRAHRSLSRRILPDPAGAPVSGRAI